MCPAPTQPQPLLKFSRASSCKVTLKHARLVEAPAESCATVPTPNPARIQALHPCPLCPPLRSPGEQPLPRADHTPERSTQVANFLSDYFSAAAAPNGVGRTSSCHQHHPRHALLRPPQCLPRTTLRPAARPGRQLLQRLRSNVGRRRPRGRWPLPGSAPARSGFGGSIRIPSHRRLTGFPAAPTSLPNAGDQQSRGDIIPPAAPLVAPPSGGPGPWRCQPGAGCSVTGAVPGTAAPA